MKETMADRIKRLRIEAGMTQEELAEHLGTQKAIISKYESGRVSNLKRETIKKMADIFNVTPSYLMCFEDELPAKSIGNVSYPAAHAIPILGTICAGDGVYADQNFDGFFFVDNSIRADCCLHVHGDSMVDAGIVDGDIVFLKKDTVIEDGSICGVVLDDGNYLCYQSYAKYFRENTEHLIGRRLTPHSLRHTHTALMAEAGVPIETISRRLGHADSKITKDVYMHVTNNMVERDRDRIKSVKMLTIC